MGDEQIMRGERVVLRRLLESDLPRVVEILSDPEIEQWWYDHDEPRLRAELFEDPRVVSYAIELGPEMIGIIEYSEENDPDYRSAGIDLALDAQHLGQGYGTDALRTMARYLFEQRGHHRLTIDPSVANPRAIAAYKKVGYRPVGVMRQYERDRSGEWRDSLLMDLLRDELQ